LWLTIDTDIPWRDSAHVRVHGALVGIHDRGAVNVALQTLPGVLPVPQLANDVAYLLLASTEPRCDEPKPLGRLEKHGIVVYDGVVEVDSNLLLAGCAHAAPLDLLAAAERENVLAHRIGAGADDLIGIERRNTAWK
jgi:hypothetical protein